MVATSMTFWSLYWLAGIHPDDQSRRILFTIPDILIQDPYILMTDLIIIRFTAKLHKYFNLSRTMKLFSGAILLGLATAATAQTEPYEFDNPNNCSGNGCSLQVSYINEYRCAFGCDRLIQL